MNVRAFLLLLTIALLPIGKMTAADEEEAPYFGEWSNTHGDMLRITSDTIQLNAEKQVRYDDITEDSDGSFFVLQITSPGELSYFDGKFLRITFGKDPDRFTMAIYKTLADALHQQNETSRAEWSATDSEINRRAQSQRAFELDLAIVRQPLPVADLPKRRQAGALALQRLRGNKSSLHPEAFAQIQLAADRVVDEKIF